MTKIHRSETGMPRSFAGRLEPIRPSTTLSDKRGTRRSGQRCVSESRQFTSIAKCPRIETSMPLGVWVDWTSIQGPLSLLVMGLVAVGCVNLDKPIAVQMCSATATCSNGAGKAAREDANNDLQHAETDLAGGRGGSGTDAGEVDVVLYPAPDLAAPDLVLDNTADQAVRVDGYKAPDATVIDDVVPASLPAQEPGPEQSGAEPGAPRPEPGPEPSQEPSMEPGPEPPLDGGVTVSPPSSSNCTIFYGSNPPQGSAGQPPSAGTLGPFCLATCDDIDGWGCSNFDGRTISVNGATVSCGARVAKKNGYYVFRASAGWLSYASIYWWGPAASACPEPAGGVFP